MQLELLPQVTATLDGGPVSSGLLTRQVATDQLLTLTLTRGGQSMSYFFRCLPADFPALTVDRPGNPAPGWYLTTFGMQPNDAGRFSVIFDNRGAPVWYKRTTEPVLDFKRLSNGTMVYVPQLGQAFGVGSCTGYLNTDLERFARRRGQPDGVIRTVNPDQPSRPTSTTTSSSRRRPGDAELSTDPIARSAAAERARSPVRRARRSTPTPARSSATDRVVDGVIQEIDSAGTSCGTGAPASTSPTPTRRSRTASRTSRCTTRRHSRASSTCTTSTRSSESRTER